MDATAKCACGHVNIDLSDNGNDDVDSGDGIEDNEMSIDIGNSNKSKSGCGKPDFRNNNADEVSWMELDKGLDELTEKEVLRLKFNCDEEAGMFYEIYAKVIGFTV